MVRPAALLLAAAASCATAAVQTAAVAPAGEPSGPRRPSPAQLARVEVRVDRFVLSSAPHLQPQAERLLAALERGLPARGLSRPDGKAGQLLVLRASIDWNDRERFDQTALTLGATLEAEAERVAEAELSQPDPFPETDAGMDALAGRLLDRLLSTGTLDLWLREREGGASSR